MAERHITIVVVVDIRQTVKTLWASSPRSAQNGALTRRQNTVTRVPVCLPRMYVGRNTENTTPFGDFFINRKMLTSARKRCSRCKGARLLIKYRRPIRLPSHESPQQRPSNASAHILCILFIQHTGGRHNWFL